MESYFNLSGNSISIVAKHTNYYNNSKAPRITNKLIWKINSFLAEQYDLLEIVFVKFNTFSLIPLDEMYLYEPNVSESELLSEYKSHEGEGISFEFFKEIYSLEMINSLKYIALKSEDVHEMYFNKKDLQNKILPISDVYISITDHDSMTITVRDKNLLSKIVTILNDYAKELP